VESLVHAGSIGFTIVTAKIVLRGASPVELGHDVPAAVPAAVGGALRAGVRELVRATGFQDGVLHSEWILVQGRPHFVECAARVPGDYIDHLIDLAYGGRFSEDYVAVLTGRGPIPERPSRRAAAIRFLTAAPGTVHAIAGTERAAAMRGIEEVSVSVAVGAAVSAVTSSWERLGHVIATGADQREAAARADASASLIEFDVVAEAA
jgi:biotin carboxylase